MTKPLKKKLVEIVQECYYLYCKQHPTKQQVYGHLPPISKAIKIRRPNHNGPSWKSKNELISNILQWTPSHRHVSVRLPTRIYLQQHCTDTESSVEDVPEVMNDKDECWERVSEIRVNSTWYILPNGNAFSRSKKIKCNIALCKFSEWKIIHFTLLFQNIEIKLCCNTEILNLIKYKGNNEFRIDEMNKHK